jgi:hypothetical protein
MKYWVPEQALKLDYRAIAEYNLAFVPLDEWTLEQKLLVSLASLQWEKHDDQRRRETAPERGQA